MARSRQFIDGWRHAEKSLTAWLYYRAEHFNDPHARALFAVAADDYGKWSKGRFRVSDREPAPNLDDPLAVFRAAVRREALEDAAKIAENWQFPSGVGTTKPGERKAIDLPTAIRAAKICERV